MTATPAPTTSATTDSVNYSPFANAYETRNFEYEPGQERQEELRFFAFGDFNKWEAVCEVNNHYYAVKESHSHTSVQIIKEIVCPNQTGENYQCWRYWSDAAGDWLCNTEDQYPAPLPGGCP